MREHTSSALPYVGTLSHKIFKLCFVLAVIFVPLYRGGVPVWSFSIAVFVLTSSFFWFLFSTKEPGSFSNPLRTELDGWIASFILFFLVSAIHTQIVYPTLVEFYKLAAVLCVFTATMAYSRERSDVQRLCTVFAFLGGGLSLLGLIQYLGGIPNSWWHRKFLLSSTYVNHNHFAGFLEMMLPVSLGYAVAQRDKTKKILFIFLSTLMGTAFAFTLSRGGSISVILALIFMLCLLAKRGVVKTAGWVFLLLVLLMLSLVAMFGIEPISQRIQTIQSLDSVSEWKVRIEIWKGAFPLIQKFFWFGSGPGTFGDLFLLFRPEGFKARPVFAHNDYLQLLSDGGVFSFLAAAGLFLCLFWTGYKIIQRDESRLRIGVGAGCLAALFSLCVHSLVDFNFHIPSNLALSAVVAGLLLSLDKDQHYSSLALRRIAGVLTAVFCLAALVGSIYFGLSDFYQSRGKQYYEKTDFGKAVESLDRAIGINKLNPESYFYRGLATARRSDSIGLSLKDRMMKSVHDFETAIALNPFEPYYDYNRARYSADYLGAEESKHVISYYKNAIKKDPKDPELSFLSGRDLLRMNTGRDRTIELSAQAMLKNCIQIDPSYAKSVYESLWEYYKRLTALEKFSREAPESLKGFVAFLERREWWEYHRYYFLLSRGVNPYEKNQLDRSNQWDGSSERFLDLDRFVATEGQQPYKHHIFYRYGQIEEEISLMSSLNRFILTLKGTKAGRAYPYLIISLDGKVIDSLYINSVDFRDYAVVFQAIPGRHTLGIKFVNDKSIETAREDRNIWIKNIRIQSSKNESHQH